jgi:RNA polymerase sigma-70 factor (ECF subfamily)
MVGVEPVERTRDAVARYEAMFREHYRAVSSYVRQVWPRVDEDEIMSRTFEIAWRRFDEMPADASRGWLIGVARHCALNDVRSQRRRRGYHEAFRAMRSRVSPDAHDEMAAFDAADALQQAFEQLRDSDQDVLLLAAWGGLSGEELGAALGVSASTASVRLFRARERLRAAHAALEVES